VLENSSVIILVLKPKPVSLSASKTTTSTIFSVMSCFCQAREYQRKYHCTTDLLFDWFGMSCMTSDNFCFYLQNRLIQTSQTGGQGYSDTSPFSILWSSSLMGEGESQQ
jgi:hypothetical protein